MIRDKRAEGGFFEAIVAVMIVTTVITALFANLLYWQGTPEISDEDHLTQVMGLSVKIQDDELTVDGLNELLVQMVSENGLQAAGIEIGLVNEGGKIILRMLAGDPLDSNPYSLRDYAIHDCGADMRLPIYYVLTLWSYV